MFIVGLVATCFFSHRGDLDNNSGIREISTSLLYYSCNSCNQKVTQACSPNTVCSPKQIVIDQDKGWWQNFKSAWELRGHEVLAECQATLFFSRYSWPRKGTLNITKHRFNNRFIYTKQRWSTVTIKSRRFWKSGGWKTIPILKSSNRQALLAELYPDHPKTTVEAPERCQGLQITASWILMILLMEEILHQLIW